MSHRLAAACHGPITRLNVDRASHSTYFDVDGKTVYHAVGRFLEKTQPHETRSPSR